MTRFFLDTSAIVKRYHQEDGSLFIDSLFDDTGHERVTSRLALTELQSALMRRMRSGEIGIETVDRIRLHVLSEVRRRQLVVMAIRPYHFMLAGRVLMSHGRMVSVRTLDAIQLACAQDLRRRGLAEVVVTSDKHLLQLAALDGFAVSDPENS